jgi:DNA-binding FrmR family transcriptional regulator
VVKKADGSTSRQFLDVGEGAPSGALLWWWLPEGFKGAVKLSVLDAKGQLVRALASDDAKLAAARRPGTRAGLNRYVWDLRHTGPVRQDPALADRRNPPLADDKEELNGPLVAPGRYTVVLEAGKERLEAPLLVVKDPRVKTSQRAFDQQLALLRQLHDKWSALNSGVNRLRRLRGQLRTLLTRLEDGQAAAAQARRLVAALDAIESVLVDPKRESVRDVLRHQAGLDDQLADMVSVVSIADEAPTTPALEVSREAMAQVDEQLARLQACCGPELAALNASLRAADVEVVAAGA